jgi:prenyl protein peptidase
MQLSFSRPLLTTSSAHLISLGLGTIYVGSIYLSKNARLRFTSKSRLKRTPHGIGNGNGNGNGNGDAGEVRERGRQRNERWRDDPDVIRARLAAVSAATVVCILCVLAVLWSNVGARLQVCFSALVLLCLFTFYSASDL